jgi:hypothetical protein
MGSPVNTKAKTQDQKQNGRCCGSSSDPLNSIAREPHKTAAAVSQDASAEDIASDRSSGCCGCH